MKGVFSLISKQQTKTFRVSYATEHKTFFIQHIVSDPLHPLHEAQKQRKRERKQEGLWLNITTGADLSKSSCVRAWARRRLRDALNDELRLRGYNKDGKLVDLKAIQGRMDLMHVLKQGKTLDLTGSMRLHVLPPLLPAKYMQLREETGRIVEVLLEAIKDEASPQASMRKTRSYADIAPVRPAQVRTSKAYGARKVIATNKSI